MALNVLILFQSCKLQAAAVLCCVWLCGGVEHVLRQWRHSTASQGDRQTRGQVCAQRGWKCVFVAPCISAAGDKNCFVCM